MEPNLSNELDIDAYPESQLVRIMSKLCGFFKNKQTKTPSLPPLADSLVSNANKSNGNMAL